MPRETNSPCPRCQVGRCRPSKATFSQVYLEWMVSAPDLPASICDVCGYREFDSIALRHLLKVLSHNDTPESSNSESPSIPPIIEPPSPKPKSSDPN